MRHNGSTPRTPSLMFPMLAEFMHRQSPRTRVLIALFPAVLFLLCVLILPYGPYRTFSIQRIFRIFGAQRGQDSESIAAMYHHESISSSSSPEDCVEVGAWKSLTSADHRFQRTSLPHAAATAFILPLSSDLLYFLSQGSNNAGVIEISDDGGRGSSNVEVDVQVYYNVADVLQSSKVCRLRSGRGKNGVGIFTPPHSPSEHHVSFAVKVRLPPGAKGSQIGVRSLETDLPHYKHDIDNLARSFDFGSVSLRSSNEAITVQSLTSKRTDIKTTNNRIQGAFRSSIIGLQTSNDLIDADISLVNAGGTTGGVCSLRTHNAAITSRVSLISEAQKNSGGTFKVSAKTSNDALDISFPTAESDYVLTVDAQTSNAPAAVNLHRTFEGEFRLQTSSEKPSVRYGEFAEDPAGTHRTRSVAISREHRGVVTGKVTWEPLEPGRAVSFVTVKSTNAAASLVLQ